MKDSRSLALLAVTAYMNAAAPQEAYAGDNDKMPRTTKALSTLLVGALANHLGGDRTLSGHMDYGLTWGGDVEGQSAPDHVDARVGGLYGARFVAARDAQYLSGTVDKEFEFDWIVRQTGPGQYEIARFGPKFNTALHLEFGGGTIRGSYRQTAELDWQIRGAYDSGGRFQITIDIPAGLDGHIEGCVCPREN